MHHTFKPKSGPVTGSAVRGPGVLGHRISASGGRSDQIHAGPLGGNDAIDDGRRIWNGCGRIATLLQSQQLAAAEVLRMR